MHSLDGKAARRRPPRPPVRRSLSRGHVARLCFGCRHCHSSLSLVVTGSSQFTMIFHRTRIVTDTRVTESATIIEEIRYRRGRSCVFVGRLTMRVRRGRARITRSVHARRPTGPSQIALAVRLLVRTSDTPINKNSRNRSVFALVLFTFNFRTRYSPMHK